jgi:hypothetical protein
MRVIDTDAGLLRESADAAVHAATQTTIHIEAEIVGRVPELLETLKDEGPYAYSLLSDVRPDGSVTLPILTTREEIRDAYTMIRGASDLLSVEPMVEIRGTWYTFHEAISIGRRKGSDTVSDNPTLALFPVSTDKGITGELVWRYRPRASLGAAPRLGAGAGPGEEAKTPLQLRREGLALHDRYIQALRDADVDALLDAMNDGAQSAVRDYVNDTGTLVTLDGKDAHRSHWEAHFGKYEIESVDLLDRVAQDWYVFAELRVTARPRGGAGGSIAFHTAEFYVPGSDGRFIVRIGHGTDPQ